MIIEPPDRKEFSDRIEKLYKSLNAEGKAWDGAFVFDKVNGYYLTGTFQNGIFVLKKDGSFGYFVMQSYERARLESPLEEVYPMSSFKSMVPFFGSKLTDVYMDTDVVPLVQVERARKYLEFKQIHSLSKAILKLRAVKSPYELSCIYEAGRMHKELLEEIVPGILREGMSEAEFAGEVYLSQLRQGHHGVARFSMFQTEFIMGQLGFGDNALYPCYFDGPGGTKGNSPAVPVMGESSRRLSRGDLVFLDVASGYNGYHTDRTQVYMFGDKPSQELAEKHDSCLKLQREIASKLVPGAVPSEIYREITESGFMNRKVKFLGHGVGLYIDEYPVLAKGFDEPLEENMLIAVEPKIEIEGVGIVGGEDSYLVSKGGGRLVTGGEKEIITVMN